MLQLARVYKALGDENRLRIVVALGTGRYGVCELAAALGLAQPTLSHHLKILRDSGLVKGEREGQQTCCSLDRQMFALYGIDVDVLLAYGEGN